MRSMLCNFDPTSSMRTLACLLLLAAGSAHAESLVFSRIAFGSCLRQEAPAPIWKAITEADPQLFIFTGDNVYADTGNPQKLRKAYGTLAAEPSFASFREGHAILGTWDDHDYGKNDAGAEWTGKQAAKDAFMEFFRTPENSPLRKRGGIYDAKICGPDGKRVQIILLDTRWYRGPLRSMTKEEAASAKASGKPGGPYVADPGSDSTMLGDEQWAWLEEQLKKPADLRLIISSIQVVPVDHGFEKWGNLPEERRKLFGMIRDTGASGVVFLSGDRHTADISVLPPQTDDGPDYPVFDITASALNQVLPAVRPEPNRYRAAGTGIYGQPNFGMIVIDWNQNDPSIRLEIRDLRGGTVRMAETRLSELAPKPSA